MSESAGDAFKAEGNVHFKAGEFLKAAAAYTKAIKAEPQNHVFYSNRSQAFLKLSKVEKALADAEKCIELNKEFVKGYHRKASALHASGKTDDAAEVLLTAIELGLDNNELVRMGITIVGKKFVGLAAARRPGGPPPPAETPAGKENKGETAPPTKKSKAPDAAPALQPAAPTGGKGTHLYQLDPESFAGLMIKDVFSEVLEKKVVPTIAYLQPGPPKPGQTEEPGLAGVGIEHAFSSPSTMTNCADFLKKHIGETGAQSAMIVVRKNHVAYPCTWKGKGGKWPCDEKKDGIVMQLEARGARALFFTEITKAGGGFSIGETHQLDADEFALFPRLFS